MFELNLGSDVACPEATLPNPVNYTETLLHYGVVTCSGLLAFLATGTNKSIYYFFRSLIMCVWKKDWKQLVKLVTETEQLPSTMISVSHLSSPTSLSSTSKSSQEPLPDLPVQPLPTPRELPSSPGLSLSIPNSIMQPIVMQSDDSNINLTAPAIQQ